MAYTHGPYADELRKSLWAMEGHFTTGLGDGGAPVTRDEILRVRGEAEATFDPTIPTHSETSDRISDVLRESEGFESSYGLELLATVHWVMTHDDDASDSSIKAHEQVRAWNARKWSLFTRPHVESGRRAVHDRALVTAR